MEFKIQIAKFVTLLFKIFVSMCFSVFYAVEERYRDIMLARIYVELKLSQHTP